MILIAGSQGQLGTELRNLFDEKTIYYVAVNSGQLDITDQVKTYQIIKALKSEIIYHCAAYTSVDRAEGPDKVLNRKVNVDGTRNIAEAAKSVGAILVYISTDYIFDGMKKSGMYQEVDVPNPINEYGRSKLLGEMIVKELLDEYYIVRTSWVFGVNGQNFIGTMKNLAEKQERISVVFDQIGRPTWSRIIAEFMDFLIYKKAPCESRQ